MNVIRVHIDHNLKKVSDLLLDISDICAHLFQFFDICIRFQ
jgi:hypothetical protein